MKKFSSLLAFVVSAGLSSHAVVNIDWSSTAGTILQSDGVTSAPYTWYAQLIWSPDASASPFNAADPFTVDPSEHVLLAQRLNTVTTTAGRIRTTPNPFDVADSNVNGFLYTRVFNVDYSATPALPTLYGNSQVTGNANNTFNGGLMLVNGNDPNTANAHNPAVVVLTAVPEPSTYALALVGLVAALWRRRVKA